MIPLTISHKNKDGGRSVKELTQQNSVYCARNMEIGPSLPPHLLREKKEESGSPTVDAERVQIGPCLPPNLTSREDKSDDEEDDDCAYGPALPPHLATKSKSSGIVGPSLPIGT